jgi:hypothetical protein
MISKIEGLRYFNFQSSKELCAFVTKASLTSQYTEYNLSTATHHKHMLDCTGIILPGAKQHGDWGMGG